MKAPAILCQIDKIGEHIGANSYPLHRLAQLRDAILDAHDVIQAAISKREKEPCALRHLLLGETEPPKGGAA